MATGCVISGVETVGLLAGTEPLPRPKLEGPKDSPDALHAEPEASAPPTSMNAMTVADDLPPKVLPPP